MLHKFKKVVSIMLLQSLFLGMNVFAYPPKKSAKKLEVLQVTKNDLFLPQAEIPWVNFFLQRIIFFETKCFENETKNVSKNISKPGFKDKSKLAIMLHRQMEIDINMNMSGDFPTYSFEKWLDFRKSLTSRDLGRAFVCLSDLCNKVLLKICYWDKILRILGEKVIPSERLSFMPKISSGGNLGLLSPEAVVKLTSLILTGFPCDAKVRNGNLQFDGMAVAVKLYSQVNEQGIIDALNNFFRFLTEISEL